MLNKNAKERPSVAEILQMPIVRQKMIEFVNSGGMSAGTGIFIKNNPTVKGPTNNIQQQVD